MISFEVYIYFFCFIFTFSIVQSRKEIVPYVCPKNLKYCECPEASNNFILFLCHAPGNQLEIQYQITVDTDWSQMSMECSDANVTFIKGMFEKFRFPISPKTVHIYNCLAPNNISYEQILSGLNVTVLKLKLESNIHDNGIFQNLNTLNEFSLEGNSIQSIHSTAFQNMNSLQAMTLNQLSIETLPEGIFNISRRIKSINLNLNKISSLPNNIFAGLKKLQNLSISFNLLSNLSSGLFANLVEVRSLKLSHNVISKIPTNVFSDLAAIELLDLSYNNLEEIPKQLFQKNFKLNKLYLNRNGNLTILPEDIFANLTELKILYLDHNNISALSENILTPLINIEIINFNNNYLKEIPDGIFNTNTKLTEIDLSVNKLSSLPSKIFSFLKELQIIRLQNNLFTSVSRNIFSNLPSLKLVDLSYNTIEAVDTLVFENSNNLTTIDFFHNNLKFNEEPFTLPPLLEYVNMSKNNIVEIPQEWKIGENLKVLNLSFNSIEAVNNQQLMFVSKSIIIDLNGNHIETVNLLDMEQNKQSFNSTTTTETYQNIHQKPTIILNNNPMRCDCNLLPFIQYLKFRNVDEDAPFEFKANSLRCNSPKDDIIYLSPLTAVVDENLSCNVTKNCDSHCICQKSAVSHNVTINCSSSQLDKLIDDLPENATKIHMENNNISSLIPIGNPEWNNVTHVYLSRNRIRNIQLPIIMSEKLRLLALDGNDLEVMPIWLIDKIYHRQDFTIMLGNNPWQCDCNALQLQKLLNSSNQVVGDINKVRCGPGLLENQQIVSISSSVLCISTSSEPSAPILVMTLSILILLVIVIMLTFFVIRNREQIKLWFFRRHMCLWLRTPDDIEAGHPL